MDGHRQAPTARKPESSAPPHPKSGTGSGEKENPLAAAIWVKSAVHAGGLVGGIGLRPADLPVLRKILDVLDGRRRLQELVVARVRQELHTAGIVQGIQDEEIQAAAVAFVEAVAAGSTEAFARKVAVGEAPEPGQDGYIEYVLNYRGRPHAELAGLSPNSRKRKRTVVHAQDALAVEHPPTEPKDGTSVKGEKLEPPAAAASRSVSEVAGANTTVSEDKLLAECDGMCEEDAEGWMRVVPQVILPKVDQVTGRIPESGISAADIAVIGDVTGGPGVASCETVFVGAGESGGTIEGSASIQARHLIVHGDAVGEGDGEGEEPTIQVDEYCVVEEIRNRSVEAGDILIAGDSHFARLEADEIIRVRGTLRGGVAQCGSFMEIVGDLGTEAGGSGTRIAVPAGSDTSRRDRRATATLNRHRSQVEALQQQLGDLEGRAQKRAKVDAYWAKLLEGEAPHPSGPLQIQTRTQHVEHCELQRQLTRHIAANEHAVQRLVEQLNPDEDGDIGAGSRDSTADDAGDGGGDSHAVAVAVGGSLYLDVAFEVAREMSREDEQLGVAYTHEGERLTDKTLRDVRSLLLAQVTAYREQQTAHLEERKKALEELHKGQAKKPKPPQMEDQVFTIPIAWSQTGEGEDEFATTVEASARALAPETVIVHSSARVKAPMQNVTVTVGGKGARATYGLAPNADKPGGWRDDTQVQEALAELTVQGVTALEVLQGQAAFPQEESRVGETPKERVDPAIAASTLNQL